MHTRCVIVTWPDLNRFPLDLCDLTWIGLDSVYRILAMTGCTIYVHSKCIYGRGSVYTENIRFLKWNRIFSISYIPTQLMLASKPTAGNAGGGVVIGQRIAHGQTYLSWGLTPGDVRIQAVPKILPAVWPLNGEVSTNGGPAQREVCNGHISTDRQTDRQAVIVIG